MIKTIKLAPESVWLDQQGAYTYALTVNMRKRHPVTQVWISEEIAEQTAVRFIKHLGRRIHKRRYRSGKETINAVVALERGPMFGRWHIHAAIEQPKTCTPNELFTAIQHIVNKMDWFRNDIHIREYQTKWWINYFMKDGTGSVVYFETNR